MNKDTEQSDDFDHEEGSEKPLLSIKSKQNGSKKMNGDAEPLLKSLRKPSDLQVKLEKHLEKSRKSNGHSRNQIVARGRLLVPGKGGFTDMRPEEPPLVPVLPPSNGKFEDIALGSPNDDELIVFKQPSSPYKGPRDCTQQLLSDGYRLDEMSDDEDLDLILPNRGEATWCTCNSNYCVLQ